MNKVSKILLLVLIVFMMMPNLVFAEEYKSGDIVELINSTGGESLKFYIDPVVEKGKYYLSSINPIVKDKSEKEIAAMFDEFKGTEDVINYFPNIKYIIELVENGILFDFEWAPASLYLYLNEEYDWDNWPETHYFNSPVYKDKYNNILMGTIHKTHSGGESWGINYIEKSDNPSYDYVFKYKEFDSEMNFYNSYEYNHFKGDLYFSIGIKEDNLDLIKKVEIEEPKEEITTTTRRQTTTTKKEVTTTKKVENTTNNKVVNTTQKKEENPKTADTNVLYILAAILAFGTIGYIGNKKAKNN